MLAQLVQDLVHLERRQDGLDQDRGPDRPHRRAQLLLGKAEDLVPEPGLEVALQLRQVEGRGESATAAPLQVVEDVEPEVEEAA